LSDSKQQAPVIEGCPVVYLDDSADNLAYFLKAFFQPEYDSAFDLELNSELKLVLADSLKQLRRSNSPF
jgi:hypothetical protein